MKTVKIGKNGNTSLNRELLRVFKPSEEVAILSEGNTVILKKLSVTKAWEIAERKSSKGPSLKEISEEVHQYRQKIK